MYNFAWANVCVDILPSWSIILVAAAAATAVLVIVSTTITPSLVVTTTIVAIVTSTVTHVWNKNHRIVHKCIQWKLQTDYILFRQY